MHTILVEHLNKIRKSIPFLEKKMPVKVTFSGKNIIIKGEELDEFVTMQIIRAIDFSFDAEDALLLKNPDFILQFLNIKDYTNKKDFELVRSRVIGTNGRAKGTIQELTGAVLAISGNQVGIIVNSEHLDTVTQAIISLIRGSKHANVFAYLEKQNKNIHSQDNDLGLKHKKDQTLAEQGL